MQTTKAQICLDSIIPLLAISKISRFWLVTVAEQAGLSLTWSQTLKTGFLVMLLMCPKEAEEWPTVLIRTSGEDLSGFALFLHLSHNL